MWFLLLTLAAVVVENDSRPTEILGSVGSMVTRSMLMVPENATSSPLVEKPVIIGHRGSSGMFPEHTAEAYRAAIDQGADYIECDVLLTKDFVPVCLHDPWLHENTDIELHPELSYLKTTATYEKKEMNSWFIWNITWAQIQSLRSVQATVGRDTNYDRQFSICSFEHYLEIAEHSARLKGVYPEVKSPKVFNKILHESGRNETIEQIIVEMMVKFGYNSKSSPAFIQSFDIESLGALSTMTPLPLVYLIEDSSNLEHISCYAMFLKGVGIWKNQAVEVDQKTNRISSITSIVKDLHSLGLLVHVYTFRNEFQNLAFDYGQDPLEEIEIFRKIGIDGYFTDFPRTMYKYFNHFECN